MSEFRYISRAALGLSSLLITPIAGEPVKIDLVKLGQETFTGKGCAECHSIESDDKAIKTGPNLYGLFQKKPVRYQVIDGHEKHETTVVANEIYLNTSLRLPKEHLSIQTKGEQKGKPYLPIMPEYKRKILTKQEERALYAYLQTLNKPENAGPSELIVVDEKGAAYDPDTDSQAVHTSYETKVYRSFVANTGSARAVHVGQKNGQNFTFDPRTLSIQRIWTGRFLDLRNEIKGRGGKENQIGKDAQLWGDDFTAIFQPMINGEVPFTDDLTNAVPRDFKTNPKGFADALKEVKGQFGGYTIERGHPVFHYQFDGNKISIRFEVTQQGKLEVEISGELKKPIVLRLPNPLAFIGTRISPATHTGNLWQISSLEKPARWSGIPSKPVASSPKIEPAVVLESPFEWEKGEGEEDLVSGYRVYSAKGPKYRVGGYPLFEPTGIDFDSNGNAVIGARTAGIWKVIDGQWVPFAHGTFEVLGVHVNEDDSMIVAQKPEISLIRDRDRDGRADSFKNLTDDFRFIGNYHAYNHGPAVDTKGNVHFNLNLQHFNGDGIFKAEGKYMGTTGGLRGWNCQITPDGKMVPYAFGLRSSAGIAFSPDDKLYYTDNQGEWMSTSKLFRIRKDGFYGHPAAMIDLADFDEAKVMKSAGGMLGKREVAAVLLPHNHVANSPGHPVWDTTAGKFGPFTNQIFIGDQTLSNIHRVYLETVNGIEQGSIMPFADQLPSGPMRLAFSPAGELWVGQTGRGWASRGGNLAALQKFTWSGETGQAIHRVEVRKDGFAIHFTQPIPEAGRESFQNTQIKSWYYLDSANYGSKQLGNREEKIEGFTWDPAGDTLNVRIKQFGEHKDKAKKAGYTARVYQISLAKTGFGKGRSDFHSKAYYTLNAVPRE